MAGLESEAQIKLKNDSHFWMQRNKVAKHDIADAYIPNVSLLQHKI
jgi:hypothetical protein